jgi:hypothetical protein
MKERKKEKTSYKCKKLTHANDFLKFCQLSLAAFHDKEIGNSVICYDGGIFLIKQK